MIVKTGPDSIAFFGGDKAEYDMSIHSNPDARAWARFFMETYDRNQFAAPDEEMMAGWFANAMMAQHDHDARVYPVTFEALVRATQNAESSADYYRERWQQTRDHLLILAQVVARYCDLPGGFHERSDMREAARSAEFFLNGEPALARARGEEP